MGTTTLLRTTDVMGVEANEDSRAADDDGSQTTSPVETNDMQNERSPVYRHDQTFLYTHKGRYTSYRDRKKYSKVIISSSVLDIKEEAFRNWSGLETVEFISPCQVGSIRWWAFGHCKSLSKIEIPASVHTIDKCAFAWCRSLQQINFSASSNLERVGHSAFGSCRSLVSVEFPSSVKYIEQSAFHGCALERVSFPRDSKLEVIGKASFKDAALQRIEIPSSVRVIEEKALSGCALQRVEFLSESKLERIGEEAFSKCPSLSSIQIPASVRLVEIRAFAECPVERVEFLAPSKLESIGKEVFSGCTLLSSVEIPASVRSIDRDAFRGCPLAQVEFLEPSKLERFGKESFLEFSELSSIEIPASVQSIDRCAFSGCAALERVGFDESSILATIGERAFFECRGLSVVAVPASVKAIEDCAFGGCLALQSVELDETSTLERIGKGTFAECPSLMRISIPASVQCIDDRAFEKCVALRRVQFTTTSRLERINANAFSECRTLTSIVVPASVQTIEEDAFRECLGLKRVEFPASSRLQRIERNAFYGCVGLSAVDLPSSVVTLKDAFRRCTNLESIVLSRDLKSVGSGCFAGCSALKKVSMHTRAKVSFGYAAFRGCTSLTNVVSCGDGQVDSFGQVDKSDRARLSEQDALRRRLMGLLSNVENGGDGANRLNSSATEIEAGHQQDLLTQILDGSGRLEEFVATMFESRLFTLEGLKRQHLNLITKRTIKSKRMQDVLVDMSIPRTPVFVMMLDGYMNVVMVAAFIYASDKFLLEQPSQAANLAVLCTTTYFLLREAQQLHSYGLLVYLDNFWNVFDSFRIALAAASAICMQTGDGGENVSEGVRYVLFCTGLVVVGGLILFLRATVLPFAEFVGGLIAVMQKLLPFLIVSFLLLFAFAYMYFTTGFDQGPGGCVPNETSDFCSLTGSMLTSLSFFFSGLEATNITWLNILFGVVIVLVLLNVVIAIVSDAWAASTSRGRDLFWGYRIAFLAEVQSLVGLFRTSRWSMRRPNAVRALAGWIDKIGNRSFRDHINWESEPYRVAKGDYTLYTACINDIFDDDLDLPISDKKKLHLMGSFERDLYWTTQRSEKRPDATDPGVSNEPDGPETTSGSKDSEGRGSSEQVNPADAAKRLDYNDHELKYPKPTKREVVTNFLWYLCFLLLGFPTCGLLWPDRVRRYLFGTKVTVEEDRFGLLKSSFEARLEELESSFESSMEDMESRLETRSRLQYQKLETKLDTLIGLLQQNPGDSRRELEDEGLTGDPESSAEIH